MSDFKGRRFPTDIILVCVRWYCKYGVSYRYLEEMMIERGITPSGDGLSLDRDRIDANRERTE